MWELILHWKSHYCSAWRTDACSDLPVPLTRTQLNSEAIMALHVNLKGDRSKTQCVFHLNYMLYWRNWPLNLQLIRKNHELWQHNIQQKQETAAAAALWPLTLRVYRSRQNAVCVSEEVSSEESGKYSTGTVKYFNKSLLLSFLLCSQFKIWLFNISMYY